MTAAGIVATATASDLDWLREQATLFAQAASVPLLQDLIALNQQFHAELYGLCVGRHQSAPPSKSA